MLSYASHIVRGDGCSPEGVEEGDFRVPDNVPGRAPAAHHPRISRIPFIQLATQLPTENRIDFLKPPEWRRSTNAT